MAYTAVVLTEESRATLLLAHSPLGGEWVVKAHHMTCDMKPAAKSLAAEFVGQEVEMTVVAVGRLVVEEGAGIVAVKVECGVPSKNAVKHVTVAHHATVKPVKSNDITDWQPCPALVLRGVVQEVA